MFSLFERNKIKLFSNFFTEFSIDYIHITYYFIKIDEWKGKVKTFRDEIFDGLMASKGGYPEGMGDFTEVEYCNLNIDNYCINEHILRFSIGLSYKF